MTTNGHNADELARMFAPDPGPVSELLDDVERFCKRFIAYPDDHAAVAHVGWIAHTHVMDAWDSTPRAGFLSPEPGSGKTRALEVTDLLVPNPVEAVNVTAAYLFRKVASEDGRPTILFDEIDTIFGAKAKEHEDIRGLLNAGHRKGAVAGRCVVRGKIVETEEIPAYCAVALAGLGWLPDTLMSRAIPIRMKRRAPHEYIEPFRRRLHEREGHALRDRLAAWGWDAVADLTGAYPDMPDTVTDRNADVWEPLIAIADLAGGAWPERMRRSAVAFVAAAMEGNPSLGVRLLTDLRTVFGERETLSTAKILDALHNIDDAPWGAIGKPPKPIDSRGLAHRLRQYGIKSTNVRDGNEVPKGYKAADFADAWSRYVGASPIGNATSATPLRPDSTEGAVIELVADDSCCAECGADVERYTDEGIAYCERHYPAEVMA